jgi:PAS domain S-box-containing protein
VLDVDPPTAPLPPESPEYRARVERLARLLGEAEGSLQEIGAGELDAVLDPVTATPILLRRAQEALARSEERYRDLVNRAPSIVCELTPEGETLFVNAAVVQVLGVSPMELQGRSWWSSVVCESAADDVRALREALRAGDVTGFELPARGADGGVRWIAWNSANRYAPDGTLESVVLFGADVSGRRQAEESARSLERERLARVEAEAANRTKSEFLAMMSHELRTPLNAIAGYADLLLLGVRGALNGAQAADLERIRRSQRHLLVLIDDVLSFTRLEAGHLQLNFGSVAVMHVLRAAQAVTEPLARARELGLEVRDCRPGLTVWADQDRVEQVLINLVTNAIKYTPGGGTVVVECEEREDCVAVHVRDTGRGIPADKAEEIFEPFTQLREGTAERQGGVGLGLAISRDLARAMRGEIVVLPVDPQGSDFVLTLPRTPAPEA